MAYGLALLTPLAVGRAERRLRRLRVESDAHASQDGRRGAIGARVEESAIRLQIERARDGDVEALGELFDSFRPDVLRLCARMLAGVDAEDSANEAFQRAQLRLDAYDPTQPFRRWLLAIAANQCIDRLRRRSLEKRLFESPESGVDDLAGNAAVSALDELVQNQRQSAVRDAIDGLPERYRAPLVLRYFADLDYDAIGAELSLTRSQVATSLFRAKQQLRKALRTEQETGI